MTFTVVAFHAHPDDESLLTGGTLARAAAEGHRVVLVTATLGEAGLADSSDGLGDRRRSELLAAAAALGCARVEVLGYRDSGLTAAVVAPHGGATGLSGREGTPGGPPASGDAAHGGASAPVRGGCGTTPVPGGSPATASPAASAVEAGPGAGLRFVDVPVAVAAERLAAILCEERADVLIGYDARGGYGHPDHVQVHRVAALAARLAGTPVLLEATVDRRALRPLLVLLKIAGRLLPSLPSGGVDTAFTPHEQLTHAVDVRRYLGQKRAALRSHTSQTTGGRGLRTVAALAALPGPLFAAVAGREWFTEPGRAPGPLHDDIFSSLR